MVLDISPMKHILERHEDLNVDVKSWERRKRSQLKKELNDILVELDAICS